MDCPVCRNHEDATNPMFDSSASTTTDAKYSSTIDYMQLTLITYIPRNQKIMSPTGLAYFTPTFTIDKVQLLNKGKTVLAETETGQSTVINAGTRYEVRWSFYIGNDQAEQFENEGTRSLLTEDGLRAAQRRFVHDGNLQEIGSPFNHIGIGTMGAKFKDDANNKYYTYDLSTTTWAALAGWDVDLFPTTSTAGDRFAWGSLTNRHEAIFIDVSVAGVLDTDAQLVLEYYDSDSSTWTEPEWWLDGTDNLAHDGYLLWKMPHPDLWGSSTAGISGASAGYYMSLRLVGGGWNSDGEIPEAAQPEIKLYLIESSETEMQLECARGPPDIISAPFAGHTAKISTQFTGAVIPQKTSHDTGKLLSLQNAVIRESATFTKPGVVLSEPMSIPEVSGTVASEVIPIANTNPEPLYVYSLLDGNGKEVSLPNPFVTYIDSGGNWEIDVPGAADGAHTIKYLPRYIEPDSSNVYNIISVTGDSTKVIYPETVWAIKSQKDVTDTDNLVDRRFTPGSITENGSVLWERSVATSASDFANSVGRSPLTQISGLRGVKKPHSSPLGITEPATLRASVSGLGIHGVPERKNARSHIQQYMSEAGNFSYMMIGFDVRGMEPMINPLFMIDAIGLSDGGFGFKVFLWSNGPLIKQKSGDVPEHWELIAEAGPILGEKMVITQTDTTLVPIPKDLNFQNDGQDYSSPYVNEDGMMYILLRPHSPTPWIAGVKRMHWESKLEPQLGHLFDMQDQDDTYVVVNEEGAKSEAPHDPARFYGSDMLLNGIFIRVDNTGSTSKEQMEFRRGVDFSYILHDSNNRGEWVQTGPNAEDYGVVTVDGTKFIPILPNQRLKVADGYYTIDSNDPGDKDDYKFYTAYKPYPVLSYIDIIDITGTASVGSKRSTIDGTVSVKETGWDSSVAYNQYEESYDDDHEDDSGTGADLGAGYIVVDFDAFGVGDPWRNEPHTFLVRYLYVQDPNLAVTYLEKSGVMVARAYYTQYGENTSIEVPRGDNLRCFWEFELINKRTA